MNYFMFTPFGILSSFYEHTSEAVYVYQRPSVHIISAIFYYAISPINIIQYTLCIH